MLKDNPVKLFMCYSHKDEALKDRLLTSLYPLINQGIIKCWEASQLKLGDDFTKEILKQINQADIFLFLLSPDSISSKYINEIELKRAFELEEPNRAIIVPVILRPCNWELLKINHFHAAPIGGKPVTSWKDKDEAFKTITSQIAELAYSIIKKNAEESDLNNIKSKKKKEERSGPSHKSVFNGDIKAKYVFGEVKNLEIKNIKKQK